MAGITVSGTRKRKRREPSPTTSVVQENTVKEEVVETPKELNDDDLADVIRSKYKTENFYVDESQAASIMQPPVVEEQNQEVKIDAGDGSCYVYFDMKLSSLDINAEILTLGIVDAGGRTFYAEFTDYDIQNVNSFAFENTIKKMKPKDTKNILEGNDWLVIGPREHIRTQLWFWITEVYGEKSNPPKNLQFVSDLGYFDYVLLVDLLTNGAPFNALPGWISPAYYDINQDIATSMSFTDVSDDYVKNCIPTAISCTFSRAEIAQAIKSFESIENNDTVIYDAQVIRCIHRNIWGLDKEN